MWNRIVDRLSCPLCSGPFELASFRESLEPVSADHLALGARHGIAEESLRVWTETGLLLCHACASWFPVWRGLPVLLPYATQAHREFSAQFQLDLANFKLQYHFPNQEPPRGERFVLRSFSKEWLEYDFDGVIWTTNYEDYEQTFLREVGFSDEDAKAGLSYLEVGCGIGITTSIAQKAFQADAIGVDLSLAALKAAQHWRANPFLHFVEASAFYLPVKEKSFDVVYSRGALHHTFSTEEAFKRVAARCRTGGKAYLWVYGTASIDQNLFRRFAYGLEKTFRPMLSRHADSALATICLAGLSGGYVLFNGVRRLRNSKMQPYNFRRAMHAARDRFTPEFAHRHKPGEVVRWFREAGFDPVEIVDWHIMPAAEQENFERNVGVRGHKRLTSAQNENAPSSAALKNS